MTGLAIASYSVHHYTVSEKHIALQYIHEMVTAFYYNKDYQNL